MIDNHAQEYFGIQPYFINLLASWASVKCTSSKSLSRKTPQKSTHTINSD